MDIKTSEKLPLESKNPRHQKAETNLPSQDQDKPSEFNTKTETKLDTLLKQLDLDKETLTYLALKKWNLKNHPDKNNNPKNVAKFQKLRPLVETLSIFLSVTELSKYHKDADFQKKITNLLKKSNFLNSDLTFLLSKSTMAIQKEALSGESEEAVVKGDVIKHNFYKACADMSGLLHEAYKNKSLSFEEAINLASRTASLMADQSEHKTFLNGTRQYKYLMKGKLWAQILVIVGTAIEWLNITEKSALKTRGQTKLDHMKTVESLAKAAAAIQPPTPKHMFGGFFSGLKQWMDATPEKSEENKSKMGKGCRAQDCKYA